MSTFRQRLIHLHSSTYLSWKQLRDIQQEDPTLLKIYETSSNHLMKQITIKKEKAEKLRFYLDDSDPVEYEKQLQSNKVMVMTKFDESYPKQLLELYDPPWVIYYRGNLELLKSSKQLAIVGTRTPTNRGVRAVACMVEELVRAQFTIISGLAVGIDACAHQQAISNKGQTIAVLGSGFDFPYPSSNKGLYSYMCRHQLVLSEYPPHHPPKKWTFPARNRIISGLARGVLVIEAKTRSGSLITADQALDQNRDIFAVPGPFDCEWSKGTNLLIQQGAKLTISAQDILEEWT
ncbi:DNA-processing protein DprA [Alkalihalophilus lindianensis]|uniref:DNA-processing protein DprA n=1 Tax=Alkalihalophilus lindianensis TaxID=1630542 RepID=A0ABU3XC12_9BACI|nr:DNA-processing protein DprA [Alkalihalophilus lindianensis]MDV2685416.1 DNA-processing protein DprA [Alkalihalophilus lindianensis]